MRLEVLNVFRRLHRVSQRVFKGDTNAMNAMRLKIKMEFMKNSHITSSDEISKLVAQGIEVEEFLRERVVQAVETEPQVYKLNIREETALEDSPPLPTQPKKV